MGVIDIETFRVRGGVGDEQFLAADKRVQQAFSPFQPGFIRRTTARGPDSTWAVITIWADAGAADAARAASTGDPAEVAFAELVERVDERRYTTLD